MTNDFEVIDVKDITPESLVIVKYIYVFGIIELALWYPTIEFLPIKLSMNSLNLMAKTADKRIRSKDFSVEGQCANH